MLGGINPSQMKALIRQMGIKQEDINATKVTIETPEKKIIIEPATVQKITMQGQESFQISGEAREENLEESSSNKIKEEDILMVMEKTGKSRKEAEKALEETEGDIAQAILNLS